jgi:DNA-binding CsgD family transcriptional regulator
MASAITSFDEAQDRQRGLGVPLELGRTCLARGRVLRRAKKWSAPGIAERGAAIRGSRRSLWTKKSTSELARIGGRTSDPTTLTETEGQVAELVATGLTNRETAARLFLSVSTVESNLRRAYRKLGVRSRGELSHKLFESRTPER